LASSGLFLVKSHTGELGAKYIQKPWNVGKKPMSIASSFQDKKPPKRYPSRMPTPRSTAVKLPNAPRTLGDAHSAIYE